ILSDIYFYLTEGCNLACRHCWLAPKHHTGEHTFPVMDFSIIQSVIEQAKPMGLSGVKLTGGEPLLHPFIDEILDLVRNEDLGLSIETNGVLCTRKLAEKIFEYRGSVSVSLDGSDAKTHEWIRGVKGSFQGALEGIQNLVRTGLKPQIIMTVMRRNRDQLKEVVRLSEFLGAGSVKFNILQPVARGEQMHRDGGALKIEELVELGQWVETELSETTDLSLDFCHPPAFSPLGKMFQGEGNNCETCGILGIIGVLPNGAYALCGIGETIPSIKSARSFL
ncbi:SynChlorMet cassette radical SAM/SPASM protein ScmF, partial [Thermodesulfobacteriota bacterium]